MKNQQEFIDKLLCELNNQINGFICMVKKIARDFQGKVTLILCSLSIILYVASYLYSSDIYFFIRDNIYLIIAGYLSIFLIYEGGGLRNHIGRSFNRCFTSILFLLVYSNIGWSIEAEDTVSVWEGIEFSVYKSNVFRSSMCMYDSEDFNFELFDYIDDCERGKNKFDVIEKRSRYGNYTYLYLCLDGNCKNTWIVR